jgi:hypothetical protein
VATLYATSNTSERTYAYGKVRKILDLRLLRGIVADTPYCLLVEILVKVRYTARVLQISAHHELPPSLAESGPSSILTEFDFLLQVDISPFATSVVRKLVGAGRWNRAHLG